MDSNTTYNNQYPSTTGGPEGDDRTGDYVHPSERQFDPASSNIYGSSQLQQQHQYHQSQQSPYHYPDQEHPQLSSSSPLRLEGDGSGSLYDHDHDDESTAAAQYHNNNLQLITPPGKILLLQTLTTLSTIVFTVIPVVIKAGPDVTWGNWYTWKDGVRLIEPFVSGLFHSWFFYSSDLMNRYRKNYGAAATASAMVGVSRSSSWGDVALDDKQAGAEGGGRNSIPLDERNQQQQHHHSLTPGRRLSSPWKETAGFKAFLANVFTFFLILYVTGAAIHTAAAFFKNILVLFLEQYSQGIGLSTHPPTTGDGQLSLALASQLKEGYLLIQDTWEHNISHYMYAFGALGMSWCEIVAYSGQVLPVGVNLARVGQVSKKSRLGVRSRKSSSSKRLVLLWILAGVLYGGIVAGVACQYPKGLYVGLAYIAALFLILAIYILTRPTGGFFTLGRHYILQTYLIACVVAAVAIVIYLGVQRFEFLTSNDKSHLASTTRP
ncbi:hypothetical protein BGX29_008084 [Mortierella sp. GBA35]|nr:hypothetical protein BGX29_008084 [Mortierella sp. GBA35]